MKKVIPVVLLVLILIIVGAVINSRSGIATTNNSTSAPVANASASSSSSSTIAMTSSGFQPSTLTVKQNQSVCFVNQDSVSHWPASNNHPTHLIYPAFDPKQPIAGGSQWCFTFDKVGSWGFHDHLQPSTMGTITVVE